MQRVIIAVCGGHNFGKTSSIKLAYKRLKRKAVTVIPNSPRNTVEVYAVLKFKGIKIGFASKGDVTKKLKDMLDLLDGARCTVIVCASRPNGTPTYEEVRRREPPFKVQ